jgi:hypothetical protein
MIDPSFTTIITVFIIYYLVVLFLEKKIIQNPNEILDKFLSVVLLVAGVSLIYFALTGNPLFGESPETYNVYIFIIGFIAILWTIPNLLEEFHFFKRFQFLRQKREKSLKKNL